MIKREHHQEWLLTITEALLLQPLKQRAGKNRERIQQALRKLARDDVASKRSVTYAILGLLQETMAYKLAFHAYSANLDCLVYAYSAIVDSFFFHKKHYISQYYR